MKDQTNYFSMGSGQFSCNEITVRSTDDTPLMLFIRQHSGSTASMLVKVNFSLNFNELTFESDNEAVAFVEKIVSGIESFGHRIIGCRGVTKRVAKRARVNFLQETIREEAPSLSNRAESEIGAPKIIEKIVEVERIVEVEKVVEVPVAGECDIATSTQIITQPVRSGQTIYAKGKNLLILGDVKRGAEVSADGSITIYGKLSGRVMAGHANEDAFVLATEFDPELISVNGVYKTQEMLESDTSTSLEGTILVTYDKAEEKLIINNGGKL